MASLNLNMGDEILEVIIKDRTGAKIEVRRCNLSDRKEGGKIIKWLKDKYDFNPLFSNGFTELDSEFLKF